MKTANYPYRLPELRPTLTLVEAQAASLAFDEILINLRYLATHQLLVLSYLPAFLGVKSRFKVENRRDHGVVSMPRLLVFLLTRRIYMFRVLCASWATYCFN